MKRIQPALQQLFEDEEKEFVVVDTLDLVGGHGLLQQLARDGYMVEHFVATTR